ncbi:MAG: hypothetical protein LBQ02_01000 [Candidatus Nomurabacteria bacterium]|jgi:hypothetical protein|nr:hypothetical protein [Candidatus Nomurabacteria bacterium]
MRKQQQKNDELPLDYTEEEFVLPEEVNSEFVDNNMTRQEGKEILQRSMEANQLNARETQLVLLQELREAFKKRLSTADAQQYYEEPKSILKAV